MRIVLEGGRFKAECTVLARLPPSRYNLEGDLLFSVAKDSKPTVWYSNNGERLGTFNGHNGAVWCIDVTRILHIYKTSQF